MMIRLKQRIGARYRVSGAAAYFLTIVISCMFFSVAHAEKTYMCKDACKNLIDPNIQIDVAESIQEGYDPCECFRKPKGKSTSRCLQCNPQNCINITDGESGSECLSMLAGGIKSNPAIDPGVLGGPGTNPVFGGAPLGEMPGTTPVDWNPGDTPLGAPGNTGNNPGEGGGPDPVTPEQCEQYEPLVAKICSPHCKYTPEGSSTITKQGYCCITVTTNKNDAQSGNYVGPAHSCICSPSPKQCVTGNGRIVGNPSSVPSGSYIARVCNPGLAAPIRECIYIDSQENLSEITITYPGYEVSSSTGGVALEVLMNTIRRRGDLSADSVFFSGDKFRNWKDISGTDMPGVYYPNTGAAGYLPDRTNFFEHPDWRLGDVSCAAPNPADQCTDPPSCFLNPAKLCKLTSTFQPNPLNPTIGQGAGRNIPCSLENPLSTQLPGEARDTGYSQDFVADFLYYYTNLFTSANSYHSSLSPSLLLDMSANPPIEWPFSYTLGMTPKTTPTGPEISRMLYSWIATKSWTSNPVFENWPRLSWQIVTSTPGRRIYTVKDMEEVLACNPDEINYPIPSVAVIVSDTYFRGHAGLIYDYDPVNGVASIVTTNWLYNSACHFTPGQPPLQFDYSNCYQINNSFGVARIVRGIKLNNIASGQISFIVDFNDRKPFYMGP